MVDRVQSNERESRGLGRRLDFLPMPAAVAIGGSGGVLAGLVIAGLSPWIGGPLFIGLAGGWMWLAYRGKPVARLADLASQPVPEPDEAVADEDETPEPEPSQSETEPRPDDARKIDPLAMVAIPAGKFTMGSPESDEEALDHERPQRTAYVPGFEIMRYPVTRGLHAEIMAGWEPPNSHGMQPEERRRFPLPDELADNEGNLPMVLVTWLDAIEFCNRLSQKQGFEPCYHIDEGKVSWSLEANGYRLPTEAEWEYACRAGTQTRYYFGDDPGDLGKHAWFDESSEGKAHPVGEKTPNNWALHDMLGNVWEWCWDWYAPYPDPPPEKSDVDPRGPDESEAPIMKGLYVTDSEGQPMKDSNGEYVRVDAKARLLRGGSFAFRARFLRCAFRFRIHPSVRNRNLGFRCVRGSRRQP